MDKKNFVFILVIDLVVIFFAFSVIYNRYQKYKVVQSLPASQKVTQTSAKSKPVIDEDIQESYPEDETEPQEQEISKPKKQQPQRQSKNEKANPKIRNILFQYKSSKAKSVEIIGDFNDWTKERLQKTGKNTFEIAIKLRPGSYAYNYLVDGKVILDPNNRKTPVDTKRGFKNSYLEIKAISK